MTNLPVQTFLIDCREAPFASHRHTPKTVYKKRDTQNKKGVHPHCKIVLLDRTLTQTKPDRKNMYSSLNFHTHNIYLNIPKKKQKTHKYILCIQFQTP